MVYDARNIFFVINVVFFIQMILNMVAIGKSHEASRPNKRCNEM
jgi:hypothetical protein